MKEKVTDRGVVQRGGGLLGFKVAFAVCGGIGAVESVKMIRELRRRGAQVKALMTSAATKFITPLSLEWATEQPVTLDDSGKAEHLEEFDVVVVAPATLNTISKAALGIADNAVLLLIASHLGAKRKIFMVPTMNVQMLEHPLYNTHVTSLKNWGTEFFEGKEEEERIKMPESVAFATWVEERVKGTK